MSSYLGGELGWFQMNSAEPEIVRALSKLEVGQVSEPVKTDDGYYLLKLNDVADGEEGPGTENVNVSQILIKPVTIDRWLSSRVASFRVIRLLPM